MQLRLPLATRGAARAWARKTLRAHRGQFAGVVVLYALATCAALVGPQILGYLVDGVTHGTGTGRIDVLAAVFLVVLAVQAALRRAARLRAGILGQRVIASAREDFVGHALRLPLGTVEAAGTGDLLSRATTDMSRVEHAVRNAAPQIAMAMLTVAVTVVAMIVTSPLLALGLLVAVILIGLSSRWYFRRVPRVIERMLRRWADVQTGMHETAEGARTAEALGLVGRRIRLGERGVRRAGDAEREIRSLQLRWAPWQDLSYVLPIAAILLIGGLAYAQGWASLGTVTTVALYAQSLSGPLDEILWWMEDLLVAGTALRRVLGVRGLESEKPAGEAPRGRDIEVRDVRFGYLTDREVLHGIDLRVPHGERLAIVGPSGAGKSTVGRLLAGVAPPSAGSVRIGDAEVSELPDDVLRGEVLLLTQEHYVFTGTLRENLALPTRRDGGDWSDAELLDALDAAGLRPWAAALPDGLDTALGADEHPVPAGTAQQLALARVVLADPHTLVLDEATSLLDTSSARELERSLASVLAGRTVIAIAHRLHTAAAADRVVVMEDGGIREVGSPDELLAAGGSYARLVAAASG